MLNNRYYTLGHMLVVLGLLMFFIILSSITGYIQEQELKQCKEQIEVLQPKADKYDAIPKWIESAYITCSSSEVPEELMTECVAYEITFRNKVVKVQSGT